MLTLSFGGGSHLGVPCRGVSLGRVEREEGKTSSDQYPKGPASFYNDGMHGLVSANGFALKENCRLGVLILFEVTYFFCHGGLI